jgi:hypothetical protein
VILLLFSLTINKYNNQIGAGPFNLKAMDWAGSFMH